MTKEYYVGSPNIFNRELFQKRLEDILDSRRLTNDGKYVRELEEFAQGYLGVKHAIAVSNATVGLEIVLKTVADPPGEVILPSFTFIASAHAVINAGFSVKFAEINEDYCINIKDIITKFYTCKNPKAIMACNLFGNICDTSNLSLLPLYPSIPIIYDSAHALGVCDNSILARYAGGFGEAEIFSLHATKFIQGGEGGLITTNNDELAHNLRLVRNFGFKPGAGPQGEVISYGTNAKMAEIPAALALTNFENIQEIQEHLFENYQTYAEYVPEGYTLPAKNTMFSNYSYIVVEVDESKRDKIVDYLHSQKIFARTYFKPCHLSGPYKYQENYLPNTEAIARRTIVLPTGQLINDSDIEHICNNLEDALNA